ncbi:TfoX/Sxy family protein [Siccirubricoccus sp. KC 17139]|uniref:TfoX/Sxy family protein n=1 Tax=Siccirubricoccus soli TaxID=2899147 RepID=A0ABT1D5W9_9PROT|nr:TfoX/Sxy family protein [Siccirubricoccus soli]MCO6417322.1 TfoX/Sxy family protein [Siccirubricoccus soli]MCP2683457.1 TfoX/Sxy family protein [Siccirubricoccus soli]
MASGGSFIAFLAEQLAPLGPVAPRRMFSGHGLFCHGVMFGLVVREALYLRGDAQNRPVFEAAGAAPFSYSRQGRRVELAYWRVPDHLLDEAEELLVWARSGLAAAQRVAAGKQAAPKRRAR